jgi:hypothetical protein
MSEWITDRLPTRDDVSGIYDIVWTIEDGDVIMRQWAGVRKGQPWQPIHKPTPYVKPKRWTVEWCNETKHYKIRLNTLYICTLPELICDDIAQRIEDLFNEVMP